MSTRSISQAVCATLAAVSAVLAPGQDIRASDASPARLEVGGATFHVWGEDIDQADGLSTWVEWLGASALSVAQISGRFPVEEVHIRLEAGSRSNPIGFGRIKRRRTPTIIFDVRPDASLEELLQDWRGYHEMAHLLIPYPGSGDIWFSEGLASYYQYFLMSRNDELSTQAAWRELVEGFQRGVEDRAGRGQSLRELAPAMWRQAAYRRVYWTGAAYFLRVDTRLRTETDGRLSVDRALSAFQECCRQNAYRQDWNAERLIEQLGRTGRADIWREEYERMIDAPAEPDVTSALERAGIVIESDRSIRFEETPQAIRLREAIAKGRPTGSR